jgi:hypothetical protein
MALGILDGPAAAEHLNAIFSLMMDRILTNQLEATG